MEPQKYSRSFELVPRIHDYPNRRKDEEGNPHCGMTYDIAPVFGRWTMAMMSNLRAMACAAQEGGDKELFEQIMRAYHYLYTRNQKKSKKGRKNRV